MKQSKPEEVTMKEEIQDILLELELKDNFILAKSEAKVIEKLEALFQQQLEERDKEDIAFITDACQLIDGFSQYAKAENDWTEWDEQTRVNLRKLLKKKYNSLETLGSSEVY